MRFPNRLRIRFSLRTLLLVVLCAGSGVTLWRNWSPWRLERVLRPAPQKPGPVTPNPQLFGAAWSPDGKYVALGGTQMTSGVYDATTGERISCFGNCFSLCFSSTGDSVLASESPRAPLIHELNLQPGLDSGPLKGPLKVIFVGASRDGRHIAASGDGIVLWTDSGSAVVLSRKFWGRVAFSPDGRFLVSSWGQIAKVWDVEHGTEKFDLRGHTERVISAEYSPDGKHLVTGGMDATARVWNAENGREEVVLACNPATHYPAFLKNGIVMVAKYAPDGAHIATATDGGNLEIWDAATHEQLLSIGHPTEISDIAFSPEGQRLLVAMNYEGLAYIWVKTRPEVRWGYLYLPEFWLFVAITAALLRELFAGWKAKPAPVVSAAIADINA